MKKTDKVAEIVTKRIVDELERIISTGKGDLPWKRPWTCSYKNGEEVYGPVNAISCKGYRGINVLTLGFFPGYQDTLWYLTLKQCLELGFRIKKDEFKHGIPVLFWIPKEIEEVDEAGTKTTKKILIKRFYTVYHWSQIDATEGQIKNKLPIAKKVEQFKKNQPKVDEKKEKINRIKKAEKLIDSMPKKPEIFHNGGNRAYYIPSRDTVHMPTKDDFETAEHYYGTLLHELVHSTGHTSRLNRKGVAESNGFGSHEYSKEELVAEIGANMLLGITGINTPATDTNTVAYCRSWLKSLKDDMNFVINAASAAQKACDFITGKGVAENG